MNTQPRHDVPAWRVVTRDGGPYLARDDGATFECIGMDREFDETFLYRQGAVQFRFRANRWDADTNTASDTYVVRLRSADIAHDMQEEAFRHLAEIETALRTYPPYAQDVPIRKVIFNRAGSVEPPEYFEIRKG